MKRYTRLQIIKHALQYYLEREASEKEKARERIVLNYVEGEVKELQQRYRIRKKINKKTE